MTAPSPCSPTTTKASASTAPTMWSCKSDGSIWFTDPAYGIDSDYEGHKSDSEIGACHVYRIDPQTGDVPHRRRRLRASERDRLLARRAASLCRRYRRDPCRDGPRHIRVFDVDDEGNLSGGGVFATCTDGLFDGFRLDEAGRIWTSAGDGVHCYDADGTLIGKILVPEVVANVAFGGPKRNRLYICAHDLALRDHAAGQRRQDVLEHRTQKWTHFWDQIRCSFPWLAHR